MSAVTSDVAIVNMALAHIGSDSIISLSDSTKPAVKANAIYTMQRDAELRAHLWTFAIARVSLAASADAPAFGLAYAYPLPADYLRAVMVGDRYAGPDMQNYRTTDSREYVMEGNAIVTDWPAPLNLQYVRRVEDPTQFDAMFVTAFAYKLAACLAMPLTNNASLRREMLASYQDTIGQAVMTNAIENPPETVPDSEWLLARL